MVNQSDNRNPVTDPNEVQNERERTLTRIPKSILSHLGVSTALAWFLFLILGYSAPIFFINPVIAKFFKLGGGGHILPGTTGGLVTVFFLIGVLSIVIPIVWRSRYTYFVMFAPSISVIGIWIIYFHERSLIITHLQHDSIIIAKLLCMSISAVSAIMGQPHIAAIMLPVCAKYGPSATQAAMSEVMPKLIPAVIHIEFGLYALTGSALLVTGCAIFQYTRRR